VIATSQTTTSTTYVDLATVGPTITVAVGASGRVLVSVTAGMTGTNASTSCFMSFATSGTGATVTPAADARALVLAGNILDQTSASFVVSGLNPVNTIFTAKYRASANTCTFLNRSIWAIPLP
jgi:hypothetical protein